MSAKHDGPKSRRLRGEDLEPRILLSATWVGTDGDDVHAGTAGDDDLAGLLGDDQFTGSAGNDVIDGGGGTDTVDYSGASAGVTVDLTITGPQAIGGGQGTDTLTNIENVKGSSHDDTFRFSQPVDGDVYSVDGQSGSNTLDLSGVSRDDLTFANGKITVEIDGGGSFVVEHTNIQHINLDSDSLRLVSWDGGAGTSDPADTANWSTDQALGPDDVVLLGDGAPSSITLGAAGETTDIAGLVLGSSTTLQLAGDVDIDGDVVVAQGQLDLGGSTLSIEGDLRLEGGTLEGGSSKVVLDGSGTQTIAGAGLELQDLEIRSSGSVVLQTDVDVQGDLDIRLVNQLNGESLRVAGDVATNDKSLSGTASIVLNGEGDQAITSDDVGELRNLTIDKTSGAVVLHNDLELSGDLTVLNGTLSSGNHTLHIQGTSNKIDLGDAVLGNTTFHTGLAGGLTTIVGDLNIDGDVEIIALSQVDGGAIRVSGDVTTSDNWIWGSADFILDGDGNQTIFTDGSGEIHNLVIDKSSGDVSLANDLEVSGKLVIVNGTLTVGSHSLEIGGLDTQVDIGDTVLHDVVFNTGGVTNVVGSLTVAGDLRIVAVSQLDGGAINVAGNVTTNDNWSWGTASIVLNGAGDQTIDTDGSGELHNLTIDKVSGDVTVLNDLELSGNIVLSNGTLSVGSNEVHFQGNDTRVELGDTELADVSLTLGGTTTLVDPLNVNGNLIVHNVNALDGASIELAGNLTSSVSFWTGDAKVVLNGAGEQLISATSSAEINGLTIDKSSGSVRLSSDVTLRDDVTVINGGLTADGHAIRFVGSNSTIELGDSTLHDVTLNVGGTTTFVDPLDVAGDLVIISASQLDGPAINVSGDVTTNDSHWWGSAKIVLNGTGQQTITTDGSGELHDVTIDKVSGQVVLGNDLDISGNLVVSSGTLSGEGHTVRFEGWDTTIDAGNSTFGNVTFNVGGTTSLVGPLDVNGSLRIDSATFLNGGPIQVAGDIETNDEWWQGSAKVVLDGTGDQTITTDGSGELHDVTIDKASGQVTLGNDLEVSGDLIVLNGSLSAGSHGLIIQGSNTLIDIGDSVLGDLTLRTGGTLTIVGELDVDGDLRIDQASQIDGGTIRVAGDVTTNDDNLWGSATIVLDGGGDQTITTDGSGELHDLAIDKTSGQVVLANDLQISGDVTVTNGLLSTATHTLTFEGTDTTLDLGSSVLGNVTFSVGGTTTIVGVLDIDGNLRINSATRLDGGPIRVAGNVTTNDNAVGGTSTLILDGTTDQTIDTDGSGELHDVTIDKASGQVVLGNDLEVSGDLTVTNGSLATGEHTLQFQGNGTRLELGGSVLGDVSFNVSGATTIVGPLDVDGDLTIVSATRLDGGPIQVAGDVTTNDNQWFGSAAIVFDGVGDQVIDTDGSGELHDVTIDKASGQVVLANDLDISGDTTVINGTLSTSVHTLTFQGGNTRLELGASTLGDVRFQVGGGTTIVGPLDIDGDLIIDSVTGFYGDEIRVAGNLTTNDTSWAGSSTIVLDGAGDQAITATGSAEVHDLKIDKTSGQVVLTSDLQIGGDLTVANGALVVGPHAVHFEGAYQRIELGGQTLGDVSFNVGGITTFVGTFDVDGDLLIDTATRFDGDPIQVAGDITTNDTAWSGSAEIVLDGADDQTISTGGSGELHDVTIDKVTGQVVLAGDLQVSGDFTIASGSVDQLGYTIAFSGSNTTIDTGHARLEAIEFRTEGTTTITNQIVVRDAVVVSSLERLDGENVYVLGSVTKHDSSYTGTARIILGVPPDCVGTAGPDSFAGCEPVEGNVYSFDGGPGLDVLDLSGFDREDLTFSDGRVEVVTESGGSFAVEFENIETIQLGDATIHVVGDADVTVDTANGPVVVLDAGNAVSVEVGGGGVATVVYDSATGGLSVTNVTGTESSSVVEIDHLGGAASAFGAIDVSLGSTVGTLQSDVDLGVVQTEHTLQEVVVGVGGSGSVAALDVPGGVGGLTVRADVGALDVGGAVSGAVTVHGDVGALSTTRVDPGAVVTVNGDLASLAIDAEGLDDDLEGQVIVSGNVGDALIGDDLEGLLRVDGDLGTVTVGDDFWPGSELRVGGNLGSLDVAEGIYGKVDVDGDAGSIDAERLASTATVDISGNLTSLTIDADGFNDDLEGQVIVGGNLTTATIGDDLEGLLRVDGDLGTVTVGDDFWPGSELRVGGNLGSLDVADGIYGRVDVDGDVGSIDAERLASTATVDISGNLTALTIDADGVDDDLEGSVVVGGDVGSVTVGDDLIGLLQVGGDVGSVEVRDNFWVQGEVRVGGNLDSLRVTFELRGTVDVGGDVGTIDVDRLMATGSVDIGGNISALTIEAPGFNDDLDGRVVIVGNAGTVTIGDDLTGLLEVGGNLESVVVGDNFWREGELRVSGDLGSLAVSKVLRGSVAVVGDVGTITTEGTVSTSSIDIGGDLTTLTIESDGTADALLGRVVVGGDAANVAIGDDLVGLLQVGGNLGSLDVGDNFWAEGELRVNGDLTSLDVMKELRGTVDIAGAAEAINVDAFTSTAAVVVGADLGTLETSSIAGTFEVVGDAGTLTVSGATAGSLDVGGDVTSATFGLVEGVVSFGSVHGATALAVAGSEHDDTFESPHSVRIDADGVVIRALPYAGGAVAVPDGESVVVGIPVPNSESWSFTWRQTSGPAIAVGATDGDQLEFVVPEAVVNTGLTFELTAMNEDGDVLVSSVTVTVQAENDAPTARAGVASEGSTTVEENQPVTLDASASTDPDDTGLSFVWRQVGGPVVELVGETSATPTFVAPEGLTNTDLVFELVASDGARSSTDTITVMVNADNDAPTAIIVGGVGGGSHAAGDHASASVMPMASGFEMIQVGTEEMFWLDAACSEDPEGQGLDFVWTQTSGPSVEIVDPTSARLQLSSPDLEPGESVTLTFEVSASDGENKSMDTVTVTVFGGEPEPEPEPEQTSADAEESVISPYDLTVGEGQQLQRSAAAIEGVAEVAAGTGSGLEDVRIEEITAQSPTELPDDIRPSDAAQPAGDLPESEVSEVSLVEFDDLDTDERRGVVSGGQSDDAVGVPGEALVSDHAGQRDAASNAIEEEATEPERGLLATVWSALFSFVRGTRTEIKQDD